MENVKHKTAIFSGILTCVLVGVLVVIKGIAYALTGSAAIFATLVDNVADLMMSGFSFLAVRYSIKPADEDHRYGHGKIEGLSALAQACVMLLSGGFALNQGISAIVNNEQSLDLSGDHTSIAIGVIVASLFVTWVISFSKSALYTQRAR